MNQIGWESITILIRWILLAFLFSSKEEWREGKRERERLVSRPREEERSSQISRNRSCDSSFLAAPWKKKKKCTETRVFRSSAVRGCPGCPRSSTLVRIFLKRSPDSSRRNSNAFGEKRKDEEEGGRRGRRGGGESDESWTPEVVLRWKSKKKIERSGNRCRITSLSNKRFAWLKKNNVSFFSSFFEFSIIDCRQSCDIWDLFVTNLFFFRIFKAFVISKAHLFNIV